MISQRTRPKVPRYTRTEWLANALEPAATCAATGSLSGTGRVQTRA